ncbi:MAG: 30S ribosomal protein S17 [Patescibacteria group bacterium]|nr:30S ribosomal protein S17 [Patescibacteria group bacterium]
MEKNQSKVIKRKFKGTVASANGHKTIVVEVVRTKMHPKYLKRYKVTKRYQVHDEKNQYQSGDVVIFVESRPISKQKRWRVVSSDEKN